jgi:hypothetical protein
MEPTLWYLLIIGLTQVGLVGLSLTVFIAPFVCLYRYYPDEPAPRVVQLAYPTIRKVPFVLFVNQTVVHREWYVASISQYAGARGSTAAKVLTFATTAGGVLQLILAMLIWTYNTSHSRRENINIAHIRLALLVIAGIGCILIGQAESALLWKYGREQQIYTEWSMMTVESRRDEIIRATQCLNKILGVSANSVVVTSQLTPIVVEDSKIIVHPQWQKVCLSVDKCSLLLHNVNDTPSDHNISHLEITDPDPSSRSEESGRGEGPPEPCSQPSIHSTTYNDYFSHIEHRMFTTGNFTSALIHVEAATSLSCTTNSITLNQNIANGNLTGTLTSNLAFEALRDLNRFATLETPIIPPEGYVTFRAYERGGNDIIVGGVQELILECDELEKNHYSIIHMVSALVLIICVFIAHFMADSHDISQFASKTLSCIGLAFFVIFCIMQYVAGNYDSSIPDFLTTENPGCMFHRLRCAQMEPREYPCNKKLLGMAFIFVEMIAFGSIMASTPAEAIIMYSTTEV